MAAAGNLIRGIIGLIAAVVLIGSLALNPFVTGWLGGYFSDQEIQNRGLEASREKHFRVVCADYFSLSYIERWTNTLHWNSGWCEDYKDRL